MSSCIICMYEFDNDDFSFLQCLHKFHKTCLASWMKYKKQCPICLFPTELAVDDVNNNGEFIDNNGHIIDSNLIESHSESHNESHNESTRTISWIELIPRIRRIQRSYYDESIQTVHLEPVPIHELLFNDEPLMRFILVSKYSGPSITNNLHNSNVDCLSRIRNIMTSRQQSRPEPRPKYRRPTILANRQRNSFIPRTPREFNFTQLTTGLRTINLENIDDEIDTDNIIQDLNLS
jgi:hypothetical protein